MAVRVVTRVCGAAQALPLSWEMRVDAEEGSGGTSPRLFAPHLRPHVQS